MKVKVVAHAVWGIIMSANRLSAMVRLFLKLTNIKKNAITLVWDVMMVKAKIAPLVHQRSSEHYQKDHVLVMKDIMILRIKEHVEVKT